MQAVGCIGEFHGIWVQVLVEEDGKGGLLWFGVRRDEKRRRWLQRFLCRLLSSRWEKPRCHLVLTSEVDSFRLVKWVLFVAEACVRRVRGATLAQKQIRRCAVSPLSAHNQVRALRVVCLASPSNSLGTLAHIVPWLVWARYTTTFFC